MSPTPARNVNPVNPVNLVSGSGEPQPAFVFGDYPPDFFDFIVIDECHRGGANKKPVPKLPVVPG